MKQIAISVFVFFMLVQGNNILFAQTPPKLTAAEYFKMEYYNDALTEYLKLYKKDPNNIDLKEKIGICYLSIRSDKSLAIPFLEDVYKSPKHKNEVLLYLAKAYHYGYKFDKAIEMYNKYREKAPAKEIAVIDRQIECCRNAIELMKEPINVSFENLGKEINSPFPDYYPFVTQDESKLVYTSRRPGNAGRQIGYQGYYTSDIYFSVEKAGLWTKAKDIGPPISTAEDEQCVGLTPDGKTLLIFVQDDEITGDIYMAQSPKGKSYKMPENLNPTVNSPYVETEASVTPDGNTIYIASDRPGGEGGTDIYMLKKLPDGNWGKPTNIGNNINTPYNEAFPRVSDDELTLYFSSKGHNSMGGYDIFKSQLDTNTNTWGEPVNIGYPINTPDDNMNFTLAKNQHDGYISMWQKDGFGDLDIYKIVFNEVDGRKTVLHGQITKEDGDYSTVNISVRNFYNQQEIETKNPTTKGKYVLPLEPGKYTLLVECLGFQTYKEDIVIMGKADYKEEMVRDITLSKYNPNPEVKTKPKAGTTPPKKTTPPVKK